MLPRAGRPFGLLRFMYASGMAASAPEAHFEITFRDPRPPHEIKFHFEKLLMTLLQPGHDDWKLVLRGAARITGCVYSVELRFECPLPTENCYTFRVDASWAHFAATYNDYFRGSSQSWFEYWTMPFQPAPLPDPLPIHAGDCSTDVYKKIEE